VSTWKAKAATANTEGPTADDEQQPKGQYAEKDDPKHFVNTIRR
jgi:hypothetical protein